MSSGLVSQRLSKEEVSRFCSDVYVFKTGIADSLVIGQTDPSSSSRLTALFSAGQLRMLGQMEDNIRGRFCFLEDAATLLSSG